jgi:Zn finger protein HypA/HybF involved in hydrogenase expression
MIEEIEQAKTEILVQAYSFTSAPIAKALEGTDNMKKQEMQQLYLLLDKFAGEVSSNNLDVVKGVKDLVARDLSLEESKDIVWCHCKLCLYEWAIDKSSADERIKCPECGSKYIRIEKDDY